MFQQGGGRRIYHSNKGTWIDDVSDHLAEK
jgi:hypothetical protein